jgi:hypothetical protein
MLVSEKYRLQREIGWSDEAEVHSGPPDPATGVPIAVKIRHGMGGPPRPNGNRERFLRAVADQQAAVAAGCRQIAPIFESGHEGDNAYYVTRHYHRSPDLLIKGRVALEASAMHRLTEGVLRALEELRDRHGRSHGNLKPTNIFLDGKHVQADLVFLSDLALREEAASEAADCYALGATLFQLVRGRMIRNFDWPIQDSPEWSRLGPAATRWREFCNLLMTPDLAKQPAALATARTAFRNMRHLGGAAKHSTISWQPGKGVLAALGGALAALLAATVAGVLWLLPANSTVKKQFSSLPLLVSFFGAGSASRLSANLPRPTLPGTPAPTTFSPVPSPTQTPATALAQLTPPAEATPPPAIAPAATAAPEPTAVSTPLLAATTTPTPPPENPGDKWIGYTALLQQFQETLAAPATTDNPPDLNNELSRLRDNVSFLPVAEDPAVTAFLHRLPAKLEATGDQPALPANLWKKDATAARQDDVPSVTYQWQQSGYRLQFNRVSPANGNAPAFYLSATTVPVQFGVVLARMAESDGKGPLSGTLSVKGPVAWEYSGGNFAVRPSWMVLDSINASYYAKAGRPTADCPMNGLSAMEAMRLARAAGCTLPTLAQWDAVLASPAGQQWLVAWQNSAKVRSPQWSAYAKAIQAQHVTGAKLPNDQCFGDRNDLSAVTSTASQNLFFEPVSSRTLKGFAHLIGNVGQYLADDARSPSKYYFAGGSAEAAPSAFQSLTAPPVVAAPFVSAADGGLRLAVLAQGNGSDKNPALDKLKLDLAAELARTQKLP